MLNPEFAALYRGFERYGELDPLLTETDPVPETIPRWDAPQYNRRLFANYQLGNRVLPWIEAHQDEPFFLFLHSYLVHNYRPGVKLREEFAVRPATNDAPADCVPPIWEREFNAATIARTVPNQPKDQYEGSRLVTYGLWPDRDVPYLESLYDATVARADQEVGRILETLRELGLEQRTIVIVVSDHGEEFLEHGGLSHAKTLYDEVLKIPWIMTGPGIESQVIDGTGFVGGLGPNLCSELLNCKVDPRMFGKNLFKETPAITLHEGVESSTVMARAARTPSAKVIMIGPHQATGTGRPLSESAAESLRSLGYLDNEPILDGENLMEFYHLLQDPDEQTNLAAEPHLSDDLQRIFLRLERFLQQEKSP